MQEAQAVARYAAEPLCLVATGDKARADGTGGFVALPHALRPPPAVVGSVEELTVASGGKRLTRHNAAVCPLQGHMRYCTLNFFSIVLFKGGRHKAARKPMSGLERWGGGLDVAPQHLPGV